MGGDSRRTVNGTRRVVVTGLGIVSSIGIGNQNVTSALEDMRSGIRYLAERKDLGFRSALSGVVEDFKPRFMRFGRKIKKSMPEFVEWAVDATLESIEDAEMPRERLQRPDVGLVFGNDSVAQPSYEQAEITARLKNTGALHSGTVFRAMNSTVTMNLNSLLGTQGAAWSLSGACASGSHAVGQAAELIASGRQTIVMCGGAQEITWESVCSFDALCAFSLREDDPAAASRPFDRHRDGLVPSGGAAAVLLEEREHALARGARIYGEVLSYAFSSDGGHIAVPSGDGIERCMVDAIGRAGISAQDIEYLSAHGTSTPVGDAVEAEAIQRVFGSKTPWVSSLKAMTGHEMWMAGAAQVVYSLLAARAGFIPGNRNFEVADERTRGIRVAAEPIGTVPGLILCNAAGFGGTNSCLVLRTGA